MVERFRREHFEMRPYADGLWVRYSDYAALEAKLAERVKVKPLEWDCRQADTAIGTYRINVFTSGVIVLLDGVIIPGGRGFVSESEAKAAAQADFDRRILSALEATPPAPKVGDVIRELVSKQSSTEPDIKAATGDRSEMYLTAAQEAGEQFPTTTADEGDPDRLFERAYAEVAGFVPPETKEADS